LHGDVGSIRIGQERKTPRDTMSQGRSRSSGVVSANFGPDRDDLTKSSARRARSPGRVAARDRTSSGWGRVGSLATKRGSVCQSGVGQKDYRFSGLPDRENPAVLPFFEASHHAGGGILKDRSHPDPGVAPRLCRPWVSARPLAYNAWPRLSEVVNPARAGA
jgi:hypothetical protein